MSSTITKYIYVNFIYFLQFIKSVRSTTGFVAHSVSLAPTTSAPVGAQRACPLWRTRGHVAEVTLQLLLHKSRMCIAKAEIKSQHGIKRLRYCNILCYLECCYMYFQYQSAQWQSNTVNCPTSAVDISTLRVTMSAMLDI